MNNNKTILVIPIEFKEDLKRLVGKIIREELVATLDESKKQSDKTLISQKEVATYFDVSSVSIHKWRKDGLLPQPIKVGGKVFFRLAEIEAILNKNRRV